MGDRNPDGTFRKGHAPVGKYGAPIKTNYNRRFWEQYFKQAEVGIGLEVSNPWS